MKFCYADPPYLNQGKKLYGYPMWDDLETHRAMIERMCQCYPDGWALSASSPRFALSFRSARPTFASPVG